MTTTSKTEILELTYQNQTKEEPLLKNKKCCSICFKPDELKRLPDEFQQCSIKKGFESYFCGNCCQIVNFLLIPQDKQNDF